MTTLSDVLEALPPERQAQVAERTARLITEEMTLQQLRGAHQLTQQAMAERLQVRQETISRLEKRADMLLSTLGDYIRAAGGELKLIAQFPDQPPVEITGLSGLQASNPQGETQDSLRYPKTHKKTGRRAKQQHILQSSTPTGAK